MTVSLAKTKGMVLGPGVTDEDLASVSVEGGEIEVVDSFTYLGSVLSSDGEVMEDIKCRIAKASRAFGCLRMAVFDNKALSIKTKRAVYECVVLAVLLYEC